MKKLFKRIMASVLTLSLLASPVLETFAAPSNEDQIGNSAEFYKNLNEAKDPYDYYQAYKDKDEMFEQMKDEEIQSFVHVLKYISIEHIIKTKNEDEKKVAKEYGKFSKKYVKGSIKEEAENKENDFELISLHAGNLSYMKNDEVKIVDDFESYKEYLQSISDFDVSRCFETMLLIDKADNQEDLEAAVIKLETELKDSDKIANNIEANKNEEELKTDTLESIQTGKDNSAIENNADVENNVLLEDKKEQESNKESSKKEKDKTIKKNQTYFDEYINEMFENEYPFSYYQTSENQIKLFGSMSNEEWNKFMTILKYLVLESINEIPKEIRTKNDITSILSSYLLPLSYTFNGNKEEILPNEDAFEYIRDYASNLSYMKDDIETAVSSFESYEEYLIYTSEFDVKRCLDLMQKIEFTTSKEEFDSLSKELLNYLSSFGMTNDTIVPEKLDDINKLMNSEEYIPSAEEMKKTNKRSRRSIAATQEARARIFAFGLPQYAEIGKIDVINYYTLNGRHKWDIKDTWTEGYLVTGKEGVTTGKEEPIFCADPTILYKKGYYNSKPFPYSDTATKILTAALYKQERQPHYNWLNTQYKYLAKQCLIWTYLNSLSNWMVARPNVNGVSNSRIRLEFGNNVHYPAPHQNYFISNHMNEFIEECIAWGRDNYMCFPDATANYYQHENGYSQPLVRFYGNYNPNLKYKLEVFQNIQGGTITNPNYKKIGYDYVVPKSFTQWNCIDRNFHGSNFDLFNYSTIGLVKEGYYNNGQWRERYSGRVVGEDESINPDTARDFRDGKTMAQRGNTQTVYDAIWNPNRLAVYQRTGGGTVTNPNYTVNSYGYITSKSNPQSYTFLTDFDKKATDILTNFSTFGLEKKGYHNNGTWKEDYTGKIFNQDGLNYLGATDWKDGKNIKNKDWVSAVYTPVWIPNEYTVTYEGNGGTWNNQTTWSEKATYDSDYVTQSNFYNRKGYTFTGWNTKPDGSGSDWTSWIGKPWKWTYDHDVTLYAQWKPNKYKVTYEGNGGSWSGGTSMQDTVTYGSDYVTRENIFTLDKASFTGWNTKADGSGDNWTSWIGKPWKWTYDHDVTLYAQWDLYPEISAPDKEYYEGEKVTKQDLMKDVVVKDNEDTDIASKVIITKIEYAYGRLVNGKHQGPYNKEYTKGMPDKELLDTWFMELDKNPGYVVHKVTYQVTDSYGHTVTTKANVKVKYNNFPVITAEDRYFTLEEAQKGVITADVLLKGEIAKGKLWTDDIEEGKLNHRTNLVEFDPSEFTELEHDAVIEVTLHAQDTMGPGGNGKETYKSIKVYIKDVILPEPPIISPDWPADTPINGQHKRIRFINKKFYNRNDNSDLSAEDSPENGGLNTQSKWYKDPDYRNIIETSFEKTSGTDYVYTANDVEKIRDFTDAHGVGNTKERSALQQFISQIMNK